MDGRLKRGYCSTHYQRLMKFGDPLAGMTKYTDPAKALAGRSVKRGSCLIWVGTKNQDGYGRVRVDDRLLSAHRVAYALSHGPVPDDMEVDHACFNRDCIEPSHLRLVTKSQNSQHRRGAQPNSKSGIRNVHFIRGAWHVRLKIKQKNHTWGPYETAEDASDAAVKLRREHFPGA